MQTRDIVEGLHNFWGFLQLPECLDEAYVNTEKILYSAFVKHFSKIIEEKYCLFTSWSKYILILEMHSYFQL